MVTCENCGRNFVGWRAKKGLKKCSECALVNYMYDQGAMTLEKYKKWEKEWVK